MHRTYIIEDEIKIKDKDLALDNYFDSSEPWSCKVSLSDSGSGYRKGYLNEEGIVILLNYLKKSGRTIDEDKIKSKKRVKIFFYI